MSKAPRIAAAAASLPCISSLLPPVPRLPGPVSVFLCGFHGSAEELRTPKAIEQRTFAGNRTDGDALPSRPEQKGAPTPRRGRSRQVEEEEGEEYEKGGGGGRRQRGGQGILMKK